MRFSTLRLLPPLSNVVLSFLCVRARIGTPWRLRYHAFSSPLKTTGVSHSIYHLDPLRMLMYHTETKQHTRKSVLYQQHLCHTRARLIITRALREGCSRMYLCLAACIWPAKSVWFCSIPCTSQETLRLRSEWYKYWKVIKNWYEDATYRVKIHLMKSYQRGVKQGSALYPVLFLLVDHGPAAFTAWKPRSWSLD